MVAPTQENPALEAPGTLLKVGVGARVFVNGAEVYLALKPVTANLLKLVARQQRVSLDRLLSEAVSDMLTKRLSASDPATLEALAAQLQPWDATSPDFEQVIAEMADFELALEGVDPAEGIPRPSELP